MSLSITPSVNAAIATSQTSSAAAVDPTTGLSGGQKSTGNPALYMNLGVSEAFTGPLGIRSPQNPEDAAALLSEVELMLSKTSDEAKDNDVRSAMSQAQASAQSALQAANDARTTLSADQALLAADQTTLQQDQDLRGRLEDQSTTLGSQITAQQSKVNDLQGKADKGDKDAAAQLPGAKQQLANLQDQKHVVDGQIATLDGQIASLVSKIATLETVTIPADQTAVTRRDAATAAAFSQLAVRLENTLQTVNNTNAGKSVRLELGFEDLQATEAKFRENQTELSTKTSERDADAKKADADPDVNNLVLGLVAGITDALAVLKQNAGAPTGPSPSAANQVNDRLRFAL